MIQFPQLILNYVQLLPYALLAFLVTVILVPLVGKLAYRIGAVDMPKQLSGRIDRNSEKKISTKVTARLGGLAMVIAILFVMGISPAANFSSWGIIAGIIVLTVVGILDDVYDLPPKYQFIAQFIAASLIVVAGTTILSVSFLGDISAFLKIFSIPIQLGDFFVYTFIFPADLITIFWIVAMINFVNWVGGVDGLNGSVSAIGALAFLLIAMQTGQLGLAILIATHLGAVLGVLPFNYFPSKIFYGFGDSINGFLLAVYAISGDIKFAGSIIILGLPLVDAVWVAMSRIRRQWKVDRSLKLLLAAPLKSDRSHLHHRLLDIGYTWKSVLLIEVIIMSGFATLAFYLSGFSINALQVMIAIIGMLIILTIITLARNRAKKIKEAQIEYLANQPKVEVKIMNGEEDKGDEEKFVY